MHLTTVLDINLKWYLLDIFISLVTDQHTTINALYTIFGLNVQIVRH